MDALERLEALRAKLRMRGAAAAPAPAESKAEAATPAVALSERALPSPRTLFSSAAPAQAAQGSVGSADAATEETAFATPAATFSFASSSEKTDLQGTPRAFDAAAVAARLARRLSPATAAARTAARAAPHGAGSASVEAESARPDTTFDSLHSCTAREAAAAKAPSSGEAETTSTAAETTAETVRPERGWSPSDSLGSLDARLKAANSAPSDSGAAAGRERAHRGASPGGSPLLASLNSTTLSAMAAAARRRREAGGVHPEAAEAEERLAEERLERIAAEARRRNKEHARLAAAAGEAAAAAANATAAATRADSARRKAEARARRLEARLWKFGRCAVTALSARRRRSTLRACLVVWRREAYVTAAAAVTATRLATRSAVVSLRAWHAVTSHARCAAAASAALAATAAGRRDERTAAAAAIKVWATHSARCAAGRGARALILRQAERMRRRLALSRALSAWRTQAAVGRAEVARASAVAAHRAAREALLKAYTENRTTMSPACKATTAKAYAKATVTDHSPELVAPPGIRPRRTPGGYAVSAAKIKRRPAARGGPAGGGSPVRRRLPL